MVKLKAYRPVGGYTHQILFKKIEKREWQHHSYITAFDQFIKIRDKYGPEYEFRPIRLPVKYWNKL